jgi:heme/copper-type cytochrome/quinol oxidase subunit 3
MHMQQSAAFSVLPLAYVVMYVACFLAYVARKDCVHESLARKMLLVLLFVTCTAIWGMYEIREREDRENVFGWLVAYFIIGSGAVLVMAS